MFSELKKPSTSQSKESVQRKSGQVSGQVLEDNRESNAIQRQPNRTGLPDNLKSGMERLSGQSLDHVKVHYNSSKPAAVQAHAYAQGSDIHLASGQEKHLPHELGHVVQQMEGRVKPTTSVGGMAVNDNPSLENEATEMGNRAVNILAPNKEILDSIQTSGTISQLNKRESHNELPNYENGSIVPLQLNKHRTYFENVSLAHEEFTKVAQLKGPGSDAEDLNETIIRIIKNIGGSVLTVLGVLVGKSTGLAMIIAGVVKSTGIDDICDIIQTKIYLWEEASSLERQLLVGLYALKWLIEAGLIYEGSEFEEGTEATNTGATWAITISAGLALIGITQLLQKTQNTIQKRISQTQNANDV